MVPSTTPATSPGPVRGAIERGSNAPDAYAEPLSGMDQIRAVVRIEPFRRLWLVLGLSSLGDWLGLLATVLFASDQVHGGAEKGLAFGGVVVMRLLPALVLGPLA